MNELENFLKQLSEIEQKYEAYKENINDFNFFNAMFNGREEVELHSRFISYLLSPNLKHGTKEKDTFLRLFVNNILEINGFDLNNCEVIPNEQDKSEHREIDILIINKEKQEAIIIENKIDANDSYHDNAEHEGKSYKGQLERYYNTITTGYYKDGNVFKEENDKRFKCREDKTYVYYLTLYKQPSDETIGELAEKGKFTREKNIIEYKTDIQKWLELCIANSEENSFTKTIIQQYLNLVIKLSNNVELAQKLQELIGKYRESAYDFVNNGKIENVAYESSIEFLKNEFKHVKWHTIADFWNELEQTLKLPVIKPICVEEITKVAHKENKKPFGITVDIGNGSELYIMNDATNGLTCGNPKSEKKKKGKDWVCIDQAIMFSKFDSKETFKIINKDERDKIIAKIIEKIKTFQLTT